MAIVCFALLCARLGLAGSSTGSLNPVSTPLGATKPGTNTPRLPSHVRVQAARRAEFAREFPEQAAMEAEAREVFDEFDVRAPGLPQWPPPACTSTSISTRVPARTVANPIARRPNISESHRETRVLERPFSTPLRHTKGYSRVLRAEDAPPRPRGAGTAPAACPARAPRSRAASPPAARRRRTPCPGRGAA